MKKEWVTIQRRPIGLYDEDTVQRHKPPVLRSRIEGDVVIVEELRDVPPEDITSDCHVELRKSKHSGGYYVAIMYKGDTLFVLGVDKASKYYQHGKDYKMVPAKNANISFNITRE